MTGSFFSSRLSATHQAYLFVTISTLCWGANAVFSRLAVGEVSPLLLVLLRWVGVILLLALFANRQIRRHARVLWHHKVYLFLMGALGFTAFNSLFYTAGHSTTAVNIGIIQGAMPGLVILGAFVVYRTKVTGLQLAGVVITMVGVMVIAAGGDLRRVTTLSFHQGDVLMVIAAALYSAYTVGLRRKPDVPPMALFTGFSIGALLAAIPGVVVESLQGNLLWPTPEGWLVVLAVTLLPSFIAQITFIRGVAMIGPGRAGIFINLVPVFASIFAVSFLGEPFEAFQAIALCLVLGGIYLAERGKGG